MALVVVNMELTNYQRALVKIHKLEDKFGSIINVPDSNPDMQEIHRLLPPIRCTSTDNYHELARWLNREGYPVAYIARVTHHSISSIGMYFSNYGIKSKKVFKYRVKSNSSTTNYYGTSLRYLAGLLLHTTFNSNITAKRQLTMHGFSIIRGSYIWCKIPDGAYYTLSYLDRFAVKKGLDSYIYPMHNKHEL